MSLSTSSLRISALAILCLSIVHPLVGQVSFGFESDALGTLISQNGWTFIQTSESVVPQVAAPVSPAPTAVGNQSVYGADSATAPSGGVAFYHTTGTSPFSLSSTAITLQFDFRRTSVDLLANGIRVAFGHDADANNYLDFGEGMAARFQDDRFSMDTFSNLGPGVLRTTLDAGNYDDWYTLRLIADLTTGIAELSFRNLTAGSATFSTVTSGSIQLAALDADAGPTTWDWVQIDLPYGVYLDNIQIGTSAVPEPATYASFAGFGALVLVFLKRRCHVSSFARLKPIVRQSGLAAAALLTLAGCSATGTAVLGSTFPPTNPSQVEVLLAPPTRHYVVIGTTRSSRYYSPEKLYETLRHQAAQYGADAIICEPMKDVAQSGGANYQLLQATMIKWDPS